MAALLLAPASAWAGIEKAGTTASGFLSVGAGADVLGMGGATLGFGGGLGAAAWNVASLGKLTGTQYVFAHSSLTGESPQDWVAAGGRFGTSRTRWGLTGLYQGDGAFEGRDASNNPTASFNASSMALGAQVAQPLGPATTIGLGMKYVSEKLGDVTGGGVTFDAGVRMQAGPFGFGAAAQNAFGKMNYGGALYDFPTNYGAGIAYSIPLSGLTLAMDANFPSAYFTDVRGGLEWRYRDRVALRTGYRKEMGAGDGEPLGGPTFGMGAGANGFWMDYGFLTGGASGSGQHRVGLTYRPGFLSGDAETEMVSAPRAARTEKLAKVQPTYVERAKAVSSPTPATPKPAPARASAPEGAAPPPVASATTPKAVAPVAIAPSHNTVDREPAKPAVAAPAPITTPAKAETPAAPAKAQAPAPPAPRPDKVKVHSGQTLADIAKEWGNTVPALMMENNMVSEKVKSGQTLKLPRKGR